MKNTTKMGVKSSLKEALSNSFIFLVYQKIYYHYHIKKFTTLLMAEYRTHMKIVGEILVTTRDELQDDDGATITYLIRRANISHSRISRILNNLVSQGLLEQADSRGACRYKISQSGREFLQAYQTFSKFADDFGLSI